ncbi:MAG: DtxR family transcriptional regulator [Desulfobulbaceae bacterium A2]|nr:MAG: DtxR family transcriptional regulator [Desulfobulbaceae bacterium A2]
MRKKSSKVPVLPAEAVVSRPLSASLEDYIEVIAHIAAAKGSARSMEIAERLGVSRASVTEALRALAQRGMINYIPYQVITLTSAGMEAADDVINRHEALKRFFVDVLAVRESTAEAGACRIEHTAPREIIDRLVLFTRFLTACPRGGTDLIQGFAAYCRDGATAGDCRNCLSQCLVDKLP